MIHKIEMTGYAVAGVISEGKRTSVDKTISRCSGTVETIYTRKQRKGHKC